MLIIVLLHRLKLCHLRWLAQQWCIMFGNLTVNLQGTVQEDRKDECEVLVVVSFADIL